MKRRNVWLLVAAVAALAVGAAAVAAFALLVKGGAAGSPGGGWSTRQYLDLNLDGPLPEQPPEDLATLLGNAPPRSLRTIVESLDRAAADESVKGVLVRPGSMSDAGWGKVQELRDALIRYRRSGKPAYAQLETAGNKEYYLATACDRIFAVPSAILDVTGLSSEVTFFAGSLDKLGVVAQFEGVGKYKNAPNQFTERGFTEPHREQMDALLDGLFEQYLAAIMQGRKKTREQAVALIDGGPYDAARALEIGLVDELLYADELQKRFPQASRTTAGRYLRSARGLTFDTRPKLAVVYVVGEIASGGSSQGGLGGEVAGSSTLAAAIRQAREDSSVRALIVRIDSPGGSGVASDVVWRELRQTAAVKPVVASMGDVAASGGYYIAMGADQIVAQPGTITGSIGVFGGKFSLRGLYDKLGLTKEVLVRGRHAALFSEYQPWNDEERAQVRGLMTAFYKDFVTKVAARRGKSYEQIDEVAQGRVWTGSAAREHGLVDRLGGFETAVALAKQKAGLSVSQDVALVALPESKGLWDVLTERQDELSEVRLLPEDARALMHFATHTPRGAWARLPFELRVR